MSTSYNDKFSIVMSLNNWKWKIYTNNFRQDVWGRESDWMGRIDQDTLAEDTLINVVTVA